MIFIAPRMAMIAAVVDDTADPDELWEPTGESMDRSTGKLTMGISRTRSMYLHTCS
jgi:hypothetical protein